MTRYYMLLAERHHEFGFAPPPGSPRRGPYMSWMFYLSNTLQPAFRDYAAQIVRNAQALSAGLP